MQNKDESIHSPSSCFFKNNKARSKKRTAAALPLVFCLCLSFALFFLPYGCGLTNTQKYYGSNYYTFTDALGRTAQVAYNPKRVVSILGSYAETWLNAGGTLVGITDDVIEEQRFEVPKDVEVIGTVKNPNAERLLALNPDFVMLSTDIAAHLSLEPILNQSKIAYAYFKVEKFSDYLAMLNVCTQITKRPDLYVQNGEQIKKTVEASIARVKALNRTPSALFLRVYSTGAKAKADDHIVTFILKDFGCVNVAEGQSPLLGDATSELSLEIVQNADPDMILATSMGDEAAAERTFSALLATPIYKGLTAVKKGKAAMLSKKLFHYKPNARWGESYEYLEKILYA